MDNIFAQYCMLIITAFTPIFWLLFFFFFVLLFFGFASIWDGEGLCVHVCGSVCVRVSVYIGEGLKEKKKNYPKLFNVLLLFPHPTSPLPF